MSSTTSSSYFPFSKRTKKRSTKIICTLGPATSSLEMITRLARAGMNCARLNFSHGTLEEHLETISSVRQVSKSLGRHIAVMQDLPGPKIRIGDIRGNSISLKKGQVITLYSDDNDNEGEEDTSSEERGESSNIPVHKINLARYVPVGAMVFLADGTIRLEVISKTKSKLKCKCLNNGALLSGKGVNVPELQRNFEGFTKQDREYLKFGLENKVDLVAVSFIRAAEELGRIRDFIKSRRPSNEPWIISKIERREAVVNHRAIVRASDAVMVARGDLGVENPIEQVPIIQKMIISECNGQAIPVITATQMLESMVGNPRPTRAEATDVANAVFDGTDALMLSEETALGTFPIECVHVLDSIAKVAEEWRYQIAPMEERYARRNLGGAGLGVASARLARAIRAKFIVCVTGHGTIPRQITRENPESEIIAISDETIANRLEIVRNVFPIVGAKTVFEKSSVRDLEQSTSKILIQNHIAKPGDKIVLASNILGDRKTGRTTDLLLATEVRGLNEKRS